MKIEQANKKNKKHGYVLVGATLKIPFFERWFPSKFRAENYAKKRGWDINETNETKK